MMKGENILKRLDKIEQITLARINRYRRLVVDGSQDEAEDHRVWIEKMIEMFAQGDKGLDICCGDFPIIEAEGVDSSDAVLGAYWRTSGDDLNFCLSGSMDYISTNYLESFPNTLKALNEWYRVLKRDGILILVVQNADVHSELKGPLGNRKKQHCFTPKTILFYLHRVGFTAQKFETEGDTIHIVANKVGYGV